MREVRDIVDRMLEDPAPAPRAAADVLAMARRAKRRRSAALAVLSSAMSVLALVLGIGAAQLARSPGPSVASPAARAAPAHGAVLAAMLIDALGPGLSAGAPQTFSDSTVVAGDGPGEQPRRVHILAAAVVPVYGRSGLGEVYAYLVDDGTNVVTPECPLAGLDQCDVIVVNGVVIRAGVRGEGMAAHYVATRFLAGGRLIVGARQEAARYPRYAPVDGLPLALPPLPSPPLPVGALVSLAADPAMLP